MKNFEYKKSYKDILFSKLEKDRILSSLRNTCILNIENKNIDTIAKDFQPLIEQFCKRFLQCLWISDKLMENKYYRAVVDKKFAQEQKINVSFDHYLRLICREIIESEELYHDINSTLIVQNANKIKHEPSNLSELPSLEKTVSIYNKFIAKLDNLLKIEKGFIRYKIELPQKNIDKNTSIEKSYHSIVFKDKMGFSCIDIMKIYPLTQRKDKLKTNIEITSYCKTTNKIFFCYEIVGRYYDMRHEELKSTGDYFLIAEKKQHKLIIGKANFELQININIKNLSAGLLEDFIEFLPDYGLDENTLMKNNIVLRCWLERRMGLFNTKTTVTKCIYYNLQVQK